MLTDIDINKVFMDGNDVLTWCQQLRNTSPDRPRPNSARLGDTRRSGCEAESLFRCPTNRHRRG